MKNLISLSAMTSTFLFCTFAFGAPLTLSKINVEAKKAAERKAALDRKAAEEKLTLEKAASEALAKAKAITQKTKGNLDAKAIDSKQKITEEVVCQVRNLKTQEKVSGTVSTQDVSKPLLLKLGSVVADEKPKQKLAIRFLAVQLAEKNQLQYQLVDLNADGEQQQGISSLEGLGLSADCSKQKRIETLDEGLPAVNDQVQTKVLSEVINLAPIIQEAAIQEATGAN